LRTFAAKKAAGGPIPQLRGYQNLSARGKRFNGEKYLFV
jgi:hypothetical protein